MQLTVFNSPITLPQFMASEQRAGLLALLIENQWNYTETGKQCGLSMRDIRYRVEASGLIAKKYAGTVREYSNKNKNLYEKMWPKIRFQILIRDKSTCQLCGARPSDGVRLHVDHIKPRKHYPNLELDPTNLRVLCATCNLSKGSLTDK